MVFHALYETCVCLDEHRAEILEMVNEFLTN